MQPLQLLQPLMMQPLQSNIMRGVSYENYGYVPTDILDTPKGYHYLLDVPGFSKTDIQVSIEEDKLMVVKSIRDRKLEGRNLEEGTKFLRQDRLYKTTTFKKKFQLPNDADPASITAECDNGVLTVVLNKLNPLPSKSVVEVPIS